MTNNNVNKPAAIQGELTYEDKVIEKIVGLAISSVDGLLAVSGGFFANLKDKVINSDNVTTGVNVEVGKKQVAIDLDIVAEYQKHIPTIFSEIKSVVEQEVKKMTDLDVVEVNVKVIDIKTKAQHEADSVSLQDRVSNVAESTGDFASEQANKLKAAVGNSTEKVKDSIAEPRVK
ncbi:Asp23/Gls24 family envelope stress response protein [Streptococcus sp. sy004]|uniref:Asp23/Gls24 family envelope stress response protein n=1 Tax=Streptococcus sp. sy004 TaxID=2600149 RepID=UPI0011B3BFEA|nr:Asp23/Gls24 family envelope stress response protein [Streptococcus sp. sy004]TWT11027.1 Asp23/Gls24 family envelope stress response protein [Streptococcus sp. sy004]